VKARQIPAEARVKVLEDALRAVLDWCPRDSYSMADVDAARAALEGK
jgi:hypothetical protein